MSINRVDICLSRRPEDLVLISGFGAVKPAKYWSTRASASRAQRGVHCPGDGQGPAGEEAYCWASADVGGRQYGVAAERGEQRCVGLAGHLGGESEDRRGAIAAPTALVSDAGWARGNCGHGDLTRTSA